MYWVGLGRVCTRYSVLVGIAVFAALGGFSCVCVPLAGHRVVRVVFSSVGLICAICGLCVGVLVLIFWVWFLLIVEVFVLNLGIVL